MPPGLHLNSRSHRPGIVTRPVSFSFAYGHSARKYRSGADAHVDALHLGAVFNQFLAIGLHRMLWSPYSYAEMRSGGIGRTQDV